MLGDDGRRQTKARSASARGVRVGLAAGLLVTLAGATPLALAAKTSRPDLVVRKGGVEVSKGRFVVGFTIKNAGNARASASKAAVATVVDGKVVVLSTVSVGGLRVGRSGSGVAKVSIPKSLKSGAHQISVCADQRRTVTESAEGNNCLDLGTYEGGTFTKSVKPKSISAPADVPKPGQTPGTTTGPGSTPAPGAAPTPSPTPKPGGGAPTPVPTPTSSIPASPVARRTGDVYKLGSSWVYVPTTYDASNQTPIRLLVWMHGCGGKSEFELWNATVGENQNYLGMAPSGAEGGCWDVNASPASVLAQIGELQTHFNIDRRRIVLGGYSSGGDMSYRMAMDYPGRVAGVLAENTSPFRDAGRTAADAAAASRKVPVVHLAHVGDTTYPIATVRTETDQLKAAGFPLKLIERPGTHYDDPDAVVDGQKVPGTDPDVKTYLLPHMTDDWQSPGL